MAKIARLPDAWMVDGKADIDGVLAGGHTRDELREVLAGAVEPGAFAATLSEQQRDGFQQKVDRSLDPVILEAEVSSLDKKGDASALALRIGKSGDDAVANMLLDRATEKGWPPGTIRSALKEGKRRRCEQENQRRIASGELVLLFDEINGRSWFHGEDHLVENKMDTAGRSYLVGLAGDPSDSAVRATHNWYLHLARSKGTRVELHPLATKPPNVAAIYVASETAKLVRLKNGAVDVVANGANEDRILMLYSNHWRPWTYTPQANQRTIARFLLNELPAAWALKHEDRLFLVGLALCVFLLPRLPGLGLVVLTGLFGLGKTLIADALGTLLNGAPPEPVAVREKDLLTRASESLLMIVDEAEPREFEKATRMLNMLAKGGLGPASALPLVCAADLRMPPGTAQRSFLMPVKKDHQGTIQINDAIYREDVLAKRDAVLSLIMQLIATRALPAIHGGQLDELVRELNREAADHPNRRNFHVIGTAWMVAAALHEAAGETLPDELLATWLKDQAQRHHDLEANTSAALAAMDTLRACAEGLSPEQFQTEYRIRYDAKTKSLRCCSRELLYALRTADRAFKCGSAGELTTALKASVETLVHRGWEINLCCKTVRGDNVHELVFPG